MFTIKFLIILPTAVEAIKLGVMTYSRTLLPPCGPLYHHFIIPVLHRDHNSTSLQKTEFIVKQAATAEKRRKSEYEILPHLLNWIRLMRSERSGGTRSSLKCSGRGGQGRWMNAKREKRLWLGGKERLLGGCCRRVEWSGERGSERWTCCCSKCWCRWACRWSTGRTRTTRLRCCSDSVVRLRWHPDSTRSYTSNFEI